MEGISISSFLLISGLSGIYSLMRMLSIFLRLLSLKKDAKDTLVWLPDKKGLFSVKSAYNVDQNHRFGPENSPHATTLKMVWSSKIHERLKIFLWRCLRDVLPTRFVLAIRIQNLDTSCPLCNSCTESTNHLFFNCPFTTAVWFASWDLRADTLFPEGMVDLVNQSASWYPFLT